MLKKIVLVFLLLSYAALAAKITAYTAPDSSYEALSKFIANNDNFLIEVYEFENYDIAKLLQGKNFTLIVDEAPVGGMSDSEKFVLCAIDKGNIYLYQSRYYTHAKFAVSNDKVLVSTENFGYGGYPQGYGNRGYGVIVEDSEISNEFSNVFNEDLNRSRRFVCPGQFTLEEREPKLYQEKFSSQQYTGDIKAVFAPNAVDDIIDLENSAKQRLYIAQLYVHDKWGTKSRPQPNALLETAISRARAGVEVKILLDSTWYNVDEEGKNNEDTVNYVNEIAKKEQLNLQAKLIDLDKLNLAQHHGKLVIADDSVLVSSINWGENSPTNNREAGVIIYGGAANYYSDVFLYDWNGGAEKQQMDWRIIGVIMLIIIIAVIIFVVLSRK